MKQIDEAREYLGKMRTEWYGVGPIASAILSAEERVERLLRVTRGHRDDAGVRWQKEVARANDRDKAAAEAQKIARANKVRLEDAIERAERAEAEVKRLERSEWELGATNKKIYADRDRLRAAMRDAIEALHDGCDPIGSITVLEDALVDDERKVEANVKPPQIATREWVYEEIDRVRSEIDAVVNRAIKLAIEKHDESAPHGSSKPIFYK